jgi:hypothetical protein
MSGGFFDYNQHKIFDIAEKIQSVIDRNYVLMTEDELRRAFISPETIKSYPGAAYHYSYPPEVIEKFKEGVELLRKAHVYAHRIDWLLSSDDGEETFLKRLNEELNNLKD